MPTTEREALHSNMPCGCPCGCSNASLAGFARLFFNALYSPGAGAGADVSAGDDVSFFTSVGIDCTLFSPHTDFTSALTGGGLAPTSFFIANTDFTSALTGGLAPTSFFIANVSRLPLTAARGFRACCSRLLALGVALLLLLLLLLLLFA